MKFVLSFLLCGLFLCVNLNGHEYGSFSLSSSLSPFVIPSDNFAFIPFSEPNINEFQVSSDDIIVRPSNAEIKVKEKGNYLISYSVASTHPESTTVGSSEWISLLVINGTSLHNTTKMGGTTTILNNRTSVTGQTIVHLDKDSQVRLKIINKAMGRLDVLNATINLVKVD